MFCITLCGHRTKKFGDPGAGESVKTSSDSKERNRYGEFKKKERLKLLRTMEILYFNETIFCQFFKIFNKFLSRFSVSFFAKFFSLNNVWKPQLTNNSHQSDILSRGGEIFYFWVKKWTGPMMFGWHHRGLKKTKVVRLLFLWRKSGENLYLYSPWVTF